MKQPIEGLALTNSFGIEVLDTNDERVIWR